MAEDDSKSSKAKFKSKWSRVFKEKEEHEQKPQHTNSFKLNEDVTDFLKPSTDKAAITRPALAPKIDIAIAQRWPDAHEVRRASATTPSNSAQQAFTPNGFRKPKRRKGLTVGFVKTVPEIIGEGGDDAEEPVSEVGRRKTMMSRSVSDRRPSGMGDASQWVGPPPTQDPRQARMPNGNEDDFRPMPVRRANTSHDEISPPVRRKQISPPVEEDPPMRKLSRTPTGLGSQDEHLSTHDENEIPVPRIDTRFTFEQTESPQHGSAESGIRRKEVPAPSPRDPESMAARKRELGSGEGMALRRASALIMDDDEDEEQKRQNMSMGVRPSQQQYDTLSRPDAESLMPEVPEPSSALSPKSATSGTGSSPFADPKYLTRHSREATPDEAQPAPQQSIRQQRANYQPSYMRAPQQPEPPQTTSTRPPVPQVQAPAPWTDENERPTRQDAQPSYMRAMQPPSGNFVPTRPPPDPSQNMNVPRDSSGSRERSPIRDRLFANSTAPGQPQPMYARPNGSSSSLNFFPPSPKYAHSRSSSKDGDSPQQQMSAGSGYQQSLPSPRFQSHSQSPPSGSPRSSVVGKPSMLSPYARGPEPSSQEFSLATKPSQAPPGRPSAGGPQIEDSASRPTSASSNRSFQRPANYFSAPRPPQVQQQQPRQVSTQQDDALRHTFDATGRTQQRQPDYPSAPNAASQNLVAKTAVGNVRQEDMHRPGSSGSLAPAPPAQRPSISPQPTSEGNPAADAAYADFAGRVAHMKDVFRLTAEKERPSDRCSPHAWLRTALWWYLRGKAGLEALLQQRPRSPDGQPRELLTQPHVDLAKTWWILSDPLEPYDQLEDNSPQYTSPAGGNNNMMLRQSIISLRSYIKALSLSLGRSQLMPPPQSLIQGQDTSIWLEYPRFTADAATVLSGMASKSYIVDQSKEGLSPLDALPLGDTKDVFCYGRFNVEVSLNTDDAETDRVVLLCVLTVLRSKRDFLTSVVVASQSELVNIKLAPRQNSERGLTWHDVSWKASVCGMVVRLPHHFDLTVRLQERDFRTLWNLVEYSRKVEHSLRADQSEKLVYEARLAELQYADSSNANAFPPDKMRRCTALVFEHTEQVADASGQRKMHRGYRLLLFTDPDHKSMASASHEVCRKGPLLFEFITDAAAHGMAAMVVRIREETRQCRILLVFSDIGSRQNFYDVLNGLTVGPDEAIVGKMNLTSMNIEPATQVEGFAQSGYQALRNLQWQKIGITNGTPEDQYSNTAQTVESENLRVIARHSTGCVTDRLNLSKGELLIRLPCADTPSLQMLRRPQEDMGMSIDTRHSHASVTDGITELMQIVRQQNTIRTLTFPTHDDLHAFQTAITGSTVRYDGLASTLSIARRRMVVPIYKKWEASNVRLQIVTHSSVVQVLVFMEDFSHADAMCFQVKSTDNFETVKGDGKGKKWAVRMVDAKFSLPHQPERGEQEVSAEEKVNRRFVNLEGLEYAEEHDDITVGFETQDGELLSLFFLLIGNADSIQIATGSHKPCLLRRLWEEASRLSDGYEGVVRFFGACVFGKAPKVCDLNGYCLGIAVGV